MRTRGAGIALLLAAAAALALAASASAAATHYKPDLRGLALKGSTETPAGDPDGSGTARVFIDMREGLLCSALTVRDVAPITAAHVHKGPAGGSGPIVATLAAPAKGASKGCAAASRSLLRDIAAHPADYYVNTHNAEHPAGALRAQLG